MENTRWVSFDIKFTRQGFENACWHRKACRAIQHGFSKPSPRSLPSNSTCILKAKPGKLDIKRRGPGILFISLPIVWQLWGNFLFLCQFSVIVSYSKSAMSSWPDKGTRREIYNAYQATCKMHLIWEVTDK